VSRRRDSSNLVADRFAAGLRPARELDSVMEFALKQLFVKISVTQLNKKASIR